MRRPALLTAFALSLAATSLGAQRPATLPRLTQLVDSAATALVRGGKAPGLGIAIARGGRIVYAKGFGFADLENRVAVSPASVFEVGSVTKQFTAAAIMQLVEQGKLSLDDPLTKFFPDWPGAGSKVTITHLLSHTSGIRNYTAIPIFLSWKTRFVPADSMIALFKSQPFDFEPGTKWSYSNSGYYLLGQIVERLSGERYDAYVAKRLAVPNGLTSVRYCDLAALVPNRVRGYATRPDGGFANAAYQEMSTPYAAGALCATASDLVKWTLALESGKVVRAESYRDMVTPRPLADGSPQAYAFGVGIGDLAGHRVVSHNGGIDGFRSQLASYPSDSLVIAVLMNGDSDLPDRLEKQVARWALGVPTPVMKDLPIPSALLEQVAGSYTGAGGTLRVFGKEGKLYIELAGPQRLQYQGGERFMIEGNSDFVLQFTPPGSRAERLVATLPGATLEFKRAP